MVARTGPTQPVRFNMVPSPFANQDTLFRGSYHFPAAYASLCIVFVGLLFVSL